MDDHLPCPPGRLLGLGVAAFAVFIVEIALMRAVAQVTWPPFAFLALSAAMLGGGLAGTALAVRPRWTWSPRLPAVGGFVVALGSPAAMLGALYVGLEPMHVGASLGPTLAFVFLLLLLGAPFVGLAFILTALLERCPEQSFRVYAADLIGAGIGAFASVSVLDGLGTAGSGILAGGLGAVATILLARTRRTRVVAGVVAVLALIGAPLFEAAVPNATRDKRVGGYEATDALRKLDGLDRLNTFDRADARVDIVPARPAPSVLIDLGAAVTRAPVYPTDEPPDDAAAAAFVASPPHDGVLVIGSGAGFEVARALSWDADRVDAVEVSSAVVAATRSDAMPSAQRVFADPRVHLHLDEARSFLERADRKWGHIVAVHTISNTAVATSAMQLAEDFLLTRESMQAMLGALDDRGVLYMTRPAVQIALLADLARDALSARGVADPDAHLALLVPTRDDPFFRGLLVFQRPVDRTALTAARGLTIEPPPPPTGRTIPTDARPFFHRLSDEVDENARARLRIEGPNLAETAVAWVGGLATLVALLALVLPLAVRRRSLRLPSPSAAQLAIAGLLGVGFMVLELSFAQRLTLLCGRPTIAFAAVVGGMLLGAGAAALAAQRRPPTLTTALVLSAVACGLTLVVPHALGFALEASSVVRAGLTALAAAIIALPLGLGFPALIGLTHRRAPGSTPWLYAINATTSVGAAALHAALAPSIGLDGTAVLAGAAYALAAALGPLARR